MLAHGQFEYRLFFKNKEQKGRAFIQASFFFPILSKAIG